MPASELRAQIAAGVRFVGYEVGGAHAGVMGIQPVCNVDLIRHAYVLPAYQSRGIGSALIAHLRSRSTRPNLIGTWAAATWAIGFYQRHGLRLVPDSLKILLLRTFWSIADRQIETSVVLASPDLSDEDAEAMARKA